MPNVPESEADRLKREAAEKLKADEEKQRLEKAEFQRQIFINASRDGMAKDQMQPHAAPTKHSQNLEDFNRQREEDKAKEQRRAEAMKHEHPQVQMAHAQMLDNQALVALELQHRAADKAAADAKALQQQTQQTAEQKTTGYKSLYDERSGDAAQKTAQLAAQHEQGEVARQTQTNARARFAEARAVDPKSYQSSSKEATDRSQRQEQRDKERPTSDAQEARANLANNSDGKPKQKGDMERE